MRDFIAESERRFDEKIKAREFDMEDPDGLFDVSDFYDDMKLKSFLRTELQRFAQELEKTVNKLTAQKGDVYGEWMIGRDDVVSLIRGSLNK